VKDRHVQIRRLAPEHPVTVLCSLLGVARSAYYAWRRDIPGPRRREDARLLLEVEKAFADSRRTYGRVRIVRELRRRGHACGERRAARLMRQQHLLARPRRRFRVSTTDSAHDGPIAPNRLAGAKAPERKDRVWAADFTFIPTAEGWLFMAAVLDLYSRRVVGWAFSQRLDSALALDALDMALRHRKPAGGLLHHSDRGVQYACADYRARLAANGLLPSMSRTANPYDNAAMESFYSTLKTECLHRHDFATRDQAKAAVFDYIETFYNQKRLHSALGYSSPANFENPNP
jgi:putative transposase